MMSDSEKRSIIANMLTAAVVIPLAFIAIYYGTMVFIYHQVTASDQGAAAEGRVESVMEPFFFFAGSKKIEVSFQADGSRYYTYFLTKNDGIKKGDTVLLYYNKIDPDTAISDETYEIKKSGLLLPIYILSAAAGLIIIIRVIVWIAEKGPQKQREADREAKEAGKYKRIDKEVKKHASFWTAYYDILKTGYQSGALSSTMRRKEDLIILSGDNPAYLCLAHHSQMTGYFSECCDGVKAYYHGKKSLAYPKEYKKLSRKLEPGLHYSCYEESLAVTAVLSPDREEALELFSKIVKLKSDSRFCEIAKRSLDDIMKFSRWCDFQKNYAAQYYSRVSAEKDSGDYSPACAILSMILEREGGTGYDLTEEEYVNILDDLLMLSLKYFAIRCEAVLERRLSPKEELLFIVQKPLEILVSFLPDCQEKRYRDIFKSIMKEYEVYESVFKECLSEYSAAQKALRH